MLHPRQLSAARVLAGWSQEELAAAARIGVATVKGLEAGSRDTRFSSVLAVLKALRRQGIEMAASSDRFAAGLLIIRGSPADVLSEGLTEGEGGRELGR